eukprot:scaffold193783_cov30-Tisochrysis_lutea.AAC.2
MPSSEDAKERRRPAVARSCSARDRTSAASSMPGFPLIATTAATRSGRSLAARSASLAPSE